MDQSDASQRRRDSIRSLIAFGLIVTAIVAVVWGWIAADQNGYIFHDRLTSVSSKANWEVGEYKSCSSSNIETAEFLTCDDPSESNLPKVFMVRFWGIVYDPGKPNTSAFFWTCRRNAEGDPAITCNHP